MVKLFSRRDAGDANANSDPSQAPQSCDGCGKDTSTDALFARLKVCSSCGHHHGLSARERISLLADPGTFKEVRANLYPTDPLGFVDKISYRQRLEEARRKTGLPDAAVIGTCQIDGQGAVLAVLDFGFLGGSMGSVVGEKIASACEMAVRKRLPLVAVTRSGGARMQEGMLSLAQMAKTAAAVQKLHEKRVPYIVLFANPTTGGVYASFGTLGDVLLAEPGALISFAGPRVARALAGEGKAESPRTAEFLLEKGQIDGVIPRSETRHTIGELLRLSTAGHLKSSGRASLSPAAGEAVGAWAAVEKARHDNRPTSMDHLQRILSSFIEIRGDRAVGDDPAVVCGPADLDGQAVMVVAQERGHKDDPARRGGHMRPEGYRKAQRAMRLGAKWGLPVLTLIDTPGADPGVESEAGGLGGAISHSMALMSSIPTPVLSAVIGEGGSGGALALGVADRVLMMENAIYSVIAPEGAAAIIYRDSSMASSVASSLKLTSHDLLSMGLVDGLVPEPEGGAHLDHERAALLLRRALREALGDLMAEPVSKLVKKRYERWRQIGRTTSATAAAAERLAGQIETGLREGTQKLTSLAQQHMPGTHHESKGEGEEPIPSKE